MILKKTLALILLLSVFYSGKLFAVPVIIADTVCAGNSTHFTLSNASGITSVHWDFGDFFNGD
ncbi:MAG: hypothetical protein WCI97_07230, partial [Bacteroidota bacterium]